MQMNIQGLVDAGTVDQGIQDVKISLWVVFLTGSIAMLIG